MSSRQERLNSDAIRRKQPEFYEEEDPLDMTLKPRQDDEAELPGPIRRGSRVLHLNLFPEAEPYEVSRENALIVVARIGVRTNPDGDAPGTPYVANLYFGNSDGRVLAIFEGEREMYGIRPMGSVEYDGIRTKFGRNAICSAAVPRQTQLHRWIQCRLDLSSIEPRPARPSSGRPRHRRQLPIPVPEDGRTQSKLS